MSLSLAIALNVVADIAIVGLLAYVMSDARLLGPHAQNAGRIAGTSPRRATAPRAKRTPRPSSVPAGVAS